jgi:hypothetical protein
MIHRMSRAGHHRDATSHYDRVNQGANCRGDWMTPRMNRAGHHRVGTNRRENRCQIGRVSLVGNPASRPDDWTNHRMSRVNRRGGTNRCPTDSANRGANCPEDRRRIEKGSQGVSRANRRLDDWRNRRMSRVGMNCCPTDSVNRGGSQVNHPLSATIHGKPRKKVHRRSRHQKAAATGCPLTDRRLRSRMTCPGPGRSRRQKATVTGYRQRVHRRHRHHCFRKSLRGRQGVTIRARSRLNCRNGLETPNGNPTGHRIGKMTPISNRASLPTGEQRYLIRLLLCGRTG